VGNVRKRQVQIEIDIKSNRAIRAIRRLGKSQDQTFRGMRRAMRDTLGDWKKQKDAIVSLDASLNLLGRGFAALKSVMQQTIGASAEQQSGIRQLQRSLGQLGTRDLPRAMRSIEAFAAAQQRTTRFGDDQTRSIVANLGQLLAGTETTTGELLTLTALVQDAAEATGKGAEEVSRQIAQIYAGNVEAIGEMIPGQREAINALRDTEGAAAAAAAALELMQSTFGGAASAIDPMEQKIANLINTWGDFTEAVGDGFSRALLDSGLLDDIQTGLEDLVVWVSENGETITRWVESFAEGFSVVSRVIGGIMEQMDEFFEARARMRAAERFEETDPLVILSERRSANVQERLDLEAQLGVSQFRGEDPALVPISGGRSFQFDQFQGEMGIAADVLTNALSAARMNVRDANALIRSSPTFEALRTLGQDLQELEMMGHVEDVEDLVDELAELQNELIAIEQERDRVQNAILEEELAAAPTIEDPSPPILDPEDLTPDVGGRGGSGELSALDQWLAQGEGLNLEAAGFGPQMDPASAAKASEAFADALRQSIGINIKEAIEVGLDVDPDVLAEMGITLGDRVGKGVGEGIGFGVADGMQIATNAIRGFTSTIPAMMEDSATSGVEKFGAVMQFLGVAASAAASIGVATKAATSWAPLLSDFFALASASAAFAAALGSGGGAGAPPQRGASGTDTGDILTGVRPEAARTGQARVVNLSIGTVMNNDQSRRDIAAAVTEAEMLGELQRGG
tara:strand:+ start:1957 stop:4185 length:2229 start_codon:yes stop_codon:yes gene_type:complete